mgnify:CR=1 FL=1
MKLYSAKSSVNNRSSAEYWVKKPKTTLYSAENGVMN